MSNDPQYVPYPSASPLVRVSPAPPRLHWGWVLLLGIITLGFFIRVWAIAQALWAKKVNGDSTAVYILGADLFFSVCLVYLTLFTGFAAPAADLSGTDLLLRNLGRLGGAALYLAAIFSLRGELEEATRLKLDGAMTFLFGALYFQSHLRNYGRKPS